MVTDPYLVSEVLSKETEIEKSIEGVYSSSTWSVPMPKFHVSSRLSCMYHSHCHHIVKTCVMSGEMGH